MSENKQCAASKFVIRRSLTETYKDSKTNRIADLFLEENNIINWDMETHQRSNLSNLNTNSATSPALPIASSLSADNIHHPDISRRLNI